MLTFLRSFSLVLVMTSSISVHICNLFHVRGANSGRITPFKGRGCLSFVSSFVGTPFSQRRANLSQNTGDSGLSYGEN